MATRNYERDYSNSFIYKLSCNDLKVTEIYVGSTTNFKNRKKQHKTNCNSEKREQYNYRVYQFIRSNGGWDNWDMVLVESYEAQNKLSLHARERYWLETLKATLNCQIPSRTHAEYYRDNKEEIIGKQKEYQKSNRDKIAEHSKEYYVNNRELISERQKEYYESNKERLAEKYVNNKETISEKGKEKFTCECGSICRKGEKQRHKKSKKHILFNQNKIDSDKKNILQQ